ncbi:hypothetical protein [Streptomyces sp. SID13726]|uniref:hypothetical protein n=1 Tax=Streptomyces sp. SID13726 TaxID=2706058 RepID=UPI0013BA9968|nr:hypothetical protein [Streptomyces sp. SID13726]NEB01239.1 hypothetical protein [Streptomyces sp. SID13726]
MFNVDQRGHVRARLLSLAEADPEVVGAAITGSDAVGADDRWSDIDLAFGIDGELGPALVRWTDILYEEFAAQHHWDLSSGSTIYRVFLLPAWLEVDIAFTPADDFGPLGPAWRTVFGRTAQLEPTAPPTRDHLVGLAWHHALHARVCIERHRWWQAEHWISAARDQLIALACLRLGHPTGYAKGAHLLPHELTGPLETTLVRSLDETELRRAFEAVVALLGREVERTDPSLGVVLRPMLVDIARGGGRASGR